MRAIIRTILLLVAAIAIIPAAYCDSTSASMSVSVQVIARTIVTVDREPAQISITSQDIARGYLDVPAAVAFRVRSNARNGYRVQFEPIAYPFTRANVTWDSQIAVVSADGSWLTRAYQQGERAGTLSVRLALSGDATPGTYAWPVRFDADSL